MSEKHDIHPAQITQLEVAFPKEQRCRFRFEGQESKDRCQGKGRTFPKYHWATENRGGFPAYRQV